MTTRPFILFPGPAAWRWGVADSPADLIDLGVPADPSPNDLAAAVAAAFERRGYAGQGTLLAIPSAWCLCAPVSTAGLSSRNRHQAMVYRLEEKLPLAAEDVIADFLPFDPSDVETFGVCAQKQTLAPLVEALESSGVAVATICPAALLALQQMVDNLPGLADVDAIVWSGDQRDALELFIFSDGRLRAWHVLPNEPANLLRHLKVEFRPKGTAAREPISIAAGDISPQIRAALSARPGLRLIDAQLPNPSTAATALTDSILAGKVMPWIDLRRDGLAVREPFRQIRTPLTWAVAAVVVCLLCLCGAMLWRASRYDQMAAGHADEQQVVFHQAFPNDVAPADVLSRLAAEERRLHGLSGDASAPVQQQSGLVTLRDLIAHLPTGDEVRYRVLELRLDQNRFTLEGQTGAHGDADLIATALRNGGTFTVDPPRTEQLAGSGVQPDAADTSESTAKGVAFTITGAMSFESAARRRPAQ